MGTAARERPVPLYPMCTAIEPDPAKIKQVPYVKNTKKNQKKINQKKIFKKSRNNTKKNLQNQTNTTEQNQEVFPKEIHEFLIRKHQLLYKKSK